MPSLNGSRSNSAEIAQSAGYVWARWLLGQNEEREGGIEFEGFRLLGQVQFGERGNDQCLGNIKFTTRLQLIIYVGVR